VVRHSAMHTTTNKHVYSSPKRNRAGNIHSGSYTGSCSGLPPVKELIEIPTSSGDGLKKSILARFRRGRRVLSPISLDVISTWRYSRRAHAFPGGGGGGGAKNLFVVKNLIFLKKV
jgi:hypothetical protein